MYTQKLIDKYFNLAKNASTFSDYPKIHIGAVMIYKNKILTMGYNTTKSNPMQKEFNKYRNIDEREFDINSHPNATHAEMACLLSTRHLDIDWNKVSIFVYSERSDGCTRLVRPCKACSKGLDERGIKDWYYTTDNGYAYERRY